MYDDNHIIYKEELTMMSSTLPPIVQAAQEQNIQSAALGYAALRALGEQHIKDCVRVSATLGLAPPEAHAPA